MNDTPVYIRDVAFVHEGAAVPTNIVRQNGRRTAIIPILKIGAASTLAIIDKIKAALPNIQANAPAGLNLKPLFDQSFFVRASIKGVVVEACIAAALTGRLAGVELAEATALAADYRQTALVAFREVETAQADVRQYQAQVGARQRARRAARRASALTKERYRAGLTNCFEVVGADRQTLDAATLLAQTQGNLLTATVALVRALGGGWE